MLKLIGKKLTALAVAAISTLTISATAFAAGFTMADAQQMALKLSQQASPWQMLKAWQLSLYRPVQPT